MASASMLAKMSKVLKVSGSEAKNVSKAIFAVREVSQLDGSSIARGMACAVNLGEAKRRFVTWPGVIAEKDSHDKSLKIFLDRFSSKRSNTRCHLELSTVKEVGNFSFISVTSASSCDGSGETTTFNTLDYGVPGSINVKQFEVLSFYDNKPIRKYLTYDEINKKFEPITCDWERKVLLGSPIIGREDDKGRADVVVGVVGVTPDGKLGPFFFTENDLCEYKL